jgi:predicted metal-binding protein
MTETNGPPATAAKAVLLVCTRCNRTGTGDQRNGVRSGTLLLDATRASQTGPDLHVQPVGCMSGCERACANRTDHPQQGRLCVLPPDVSTAGAIV